MALVWVDGFEGYGSTNNSAPSPSGILDDKYQNTTNESQYRKFNAGDVRTDWSLRLAPAAYYQRTQTQDVISGDTTIAGLGFYPYQVGGYTDVADWPLLCFKNSSDEMNVELIYLNGSFFVNGPNSTYLGGTRVNIEAQEYHFVEMKVYHHATNGTVDVRVNNCPVLSLSSVNTINTGGATDRVGIGDAGHTLGHAQYSRIDDFYVCDGSGSKNNDFLGDLTIRTLWPDGDNTTQFATTGNGSKSTHYEQVNMEETLRSTDYVEDGTSGNRDKFTFEDTSDGFDTIHGIMLWAQANYVTSATNYRLLVDSNGTEDESANIAASASFTYDGNVWEDDPDTSTAWTSSTINALIAGFEVQ